MPAPQFNPGFRLSTVDIAVIIIGTILSVCLWQQTWWIGFIVAFVTSHFFLFCNIVRMARPLELAWSAIFVILAGATITSESPGWPITIAVSLAATVVVVLLEMRKPSYHGIAWQRINPGLPAWWEVNVATR
jgi:hypothetical protein